jgi:hypothetical protein
MDGFRPVYAGYNDTCSLYNISLESMPAVMSLLSWEVCIRSVR